MECSRIPARVIMGLKVIINDIIQCELLMAEGLINTPAKDEHKAQPYPFEKCVYFRDSNHSWKGGCHCCSHLTTG